MVQIQYLMQISKKFKEKKVASTEVGQSGTGYILGDILIE